MSQYLEFLRYALFLIKRNISKQCRPRSDATNVASDQGLHCLHKTNGFLARLDEVQEELFLLTPASVWALAKCSRFYVKVFYVMGKALSGELSCFCDRSCSS